MIAEAVKEALVEMNFFAQTIGSVSGARSAEKLIEKIPGLSRDDHGSSVTALEACGPGAQLRPLHPRRRRGPHFLTYRSQYPDVQD